MNIFRLSDFKLYVVIILLLFFFHSILFFYLFPHLFAFLVRFYYSILPFVDIPLLIGFVYVFVCFCFCFTFSYICIVSRAFFYYYFYFMPSCLPDILFYSLLLIGMEVGTVVSLPFIWMGVDSSFYALPHPTIPMPPSSHLGTDPTCPTCLPYPTHPTPFPPFSHSSPPYLPLPTFSALLTPHYLVPAW